MIHSRCLSTVYLTLECELAQWSAYLHSLLSLKLWPPEKFLFFCQLTGTCCLYFVQHSLLFSVSESMRVSSLGICWKQKLLVPFQDAVSWAS